MLAQAAAPILLSNDARMTAPGDLMGQYAGSRTTEERGVTVPLGAAVFGPYAPGRLHTPVASGFTATPRAKSLC